MTRLTGTDALKALVTDWHYLTDGEVHVGRGARLKGKRAFVKGTIKNGRMHTVHGIVAEVVVDGNITFVSKTVND